VFVLHGEMSFSREAKAAASAGATRIKTTARRTRPTRKLISQGLSGLVYRYLTTFSLEVHDLIGKIFSRLQIKLHLG